MTFESLLTHKIYKRVATSSQNSLGEWVYSYTTSTSSINCRVAPVTFEITRDLPGELKNIKYIVLMDADEDIDMGDRCIYNSKEYFVVQSKIDSEGHHKTLYIKEL